MPRACFSQVTNITAACAGARQTVITLLNALRASVPQFQQGNYGAITTFERVTRAATINADARIMISAHPEWFDSS